MEEMPKNYDPQTAEPELIERWMSAGCYQRSKGVGAHALHCTDEGRKVKPEA